MNGTEKHELSAPEQIRYPGGKDGMWEVRCSCGYRAWPHGYPGHAEKAADEHRRAKLANAQPKRPG